ncbi:putative trafficking protein particle complex subunit [Cocos nucifera]|uniref:Putative trafficking protein particle complex subunit n=1 Tax=Cocos nucifera TaxID=13894 RepID=A0A8K0IFY8_COCNU|nr:putative trafficking protein particle complex subunit [Cocos nucifera]
MSGHQPGGSPTRHSLAFRVMRLCRPSFQAEDAILRLDPSDLLVGEDIFDDPRVSPHLLDRFSAGGGLDFSFRNRFQLQNPIDAMALTGNLILPQSFGAIYLGETFCSYISINNSSNFEARDVVIKENTFLEACIENHTKSNLYMDQVDFEPAQHWTATRLEADEHASEFNSQMRGIFRSPVLIRAGGGIYNYLYQLRLSSQEAGHAKVDRGNILGKLQITWRTNLGEPGRLQTQQIHGTPIAHKDIDVQVVEVPSVIILERPFLVHLCLTNQTDRTVGPFEIWISRSITSDEKVVMINGIQKLVLSAVEAFSSANFSLNLIATRLGVQKISGIAVFDAHQKKLYDPLPEMEIFVDTD